MSYHAFQVLTGQEIVIARKLNQRLAHTFGVEDAVVVPTKLVIAYNQRVYDEILVPSYIFVKKTVIDNMKIIWQFIRYSAGVIGYVQGQVTEEEMERLHERTETEVELQIFNPIVIKALKKTVKNIAEKIRKGKTIYRLLRSQILKSVDFFAFVAKYENNDLLSNGLQLLTG